MENVNHDKHNNWIQRCRIQWGIQFSKDKWRFRIKETLKTGLYCPGIYKNTQVSKLTYLLLSGNKDKHKEQRLHSTGAEVAWCWSGCEEIPHIQGQRNHSKMVGGAKSHLESNPILARAAQRAQTNLVHTRTQRFHGDWGRTVFECLLWRYGLAVDCCRDRSSGCSRPGYGISPFGKRSPLTTPQSCQNLHWTGETDSWRDQT